MNSSHNKNHINYITFPANLQMDFSLRNALVASSLSASHTFINTRRISSSLTFTSYKATVTSFISLPLPLTVPATKSCFLETKGHCLFLQLLL